MGSLPELSILKGDQRAFDTRKLHTVFEEHLKATKCYEDTAIIYEENGVNKTISYKELDETSNKMAKALINLISNNSLNPNGDGDFIVAVCMLPSHKLITTLLSIWKAGAAYLPLDPTFPDQRVKHIVEDSKPVIYIHDGSSNTGAVTSAILLSYSELVSEASNQSTESIIPVDSYLNKTTESVAVVLYTSGSTGIPKGVRLPHEVIQNRLQWQYSQFPFSPSERVCVFKTALTFVDSICELWGPLLKGLAVLVVPKNITRDPQQLVDMLTKYKIERLVLVPSLLRSMMLYISLDSKSPRLPDLRLWVSSGETLPVSLAEEFFTNFRGPHRTLCNFYGSTEIMADVTFCSVMSSEQLMGVDKMPIGNPVFNTIVYLLDDSQEPVPKGETGEMWVSGANLSSGYVNGREPGRFAVNPLARSQAYSKMYRTGDFARIEKGTLVYEGRTDSQIKIRGHRVDLLEVEKAVHSIKGIDKGVVLCYKAGEMDQALLAFITCTPESKYTGLQIESKLQDKLAAYMIPQVIIIDHIPLLVNGKNDRQALLKAYENTNNNDDDAIALDLDYTGISESKMSAAKTLFETVGSVIGRSTRHTLSVKSNYYELGGNSLNSIYTITKLKEQGYEIGITDFILAQNLGEILNKICSDGNAQPKEESAQYISEPLQNSNKNDCIEMIVSSFYEKADLEQWLRPSIQHDDYRRLLEAVWNYLVDADLSFVVRSLDGKAAGVSLSFDVRREPELEIDSDLAIVMDFLEFVEGPIRDEHLPMAPGKVVHSFMTATHETLSPRQNVAVMQFLEEEIVRVAKKHGFIGIFTTNTSPLTQQLGTDVMGYKTMLDYQVNQYVTPNGNRPFEKAPDSQRAVVSWKQLE